MNGLKKKLPLLLTISVPLSLYFFIFRSLILHLQTHLLDWYDFPYYAWTLNQNISHFRSLQLNGFFNTNIYYPHQGTLLFSDLLLPQSFTGLLFSFVTTNPITIVNCVFLVTLILNVVAFTFFWRRLFKDITTVFLLVFLSSLAPFLFLQLGHLQMITLWPFFLTLGTLLQSHRYWTHALLIAFLATIQFTASIYLGIFLLVAICWWGLIYFRSSKFFFLIFLGFYFVLNSFFIYKYLEIKNAYQITRSHGEYVVYSAHLTDYLFIPMPSVGNQLTQFWQKFNNHGIGELASYPGTIVMLLSLSGFFSLKLTPKQWQLGFKPNPHHLFFAGLIIGGFLFSLGPRLSVNGIYANIPLPYFIPFKLIPLFEPLRATARWSFLFYLALFYFAGHGFEKLFKNSTQKWLILTVICTWHMIELTPLKYSSQAQNYYQPLHKRLQSECQTQPKVVLEYPITESHPEAHVISNLTYKTQSMLASTRHRCYLINGYSGFEPQEYLNFETQLVTSVNTHQRQDFYALLKEKGVNFIKLNSARLASESATTTVNWLTATSSAEIIASDSADLLIQLHD